MSKILNAEEILSINDVTIEKVDVPEWGGHVFVKAMTAGERDDWQASLMTEKLVMGKKQLVQDITNASAKLLVVCICDEAGNLIFNKKQTEQLAKKSAAAVDRLVKVAQRLSGLGDDELKDAVKNSESDQN